MEMPLCLPSAVLMMNWPLSISSFTTVSGSTPNFSLIIFRAIVGFTVPPQFTPIMTMLSRLIWPRLAISYMAIASQPFTTTPIFMFGSALSTHLASCLGTSSVPQWREPAVWMTSFGSVMSAGTAS